MSQSNLSKIQSFMVALAIVLLTVLSLFSTLKFPLSSGQNVYKTFEDLLATAESIEMQNAMSYEKDTVDEKYRALRTQLQGESLFFSHESPFSVNTIDFSTSLSDTAECLYYWFKTVQIDSLSNNLEEAQSKLLKESDSYDAERLKIQIRDLQAELLELSLELSKMDPSIVHEQSISYLRLLLTPVTADEFDIEQLLISDFSAFLVAALFIIKIVLFALSFIFLPFGLFISALKAIFGVLMCKDQQEKAYTRAMNEFGSVISWVSIYLATAIIWSAKISFLGLLLPVVALGVIAANLLASRLKNYSNRELKYLNLMQLTSFIGFCGGLLFLWKLGDANLLDFYQRELTNFDINASENSMKMLFCISFSVYLMLAYIPIFKGLFGKLARCACMEPRQMKAGKSHSHTLSVVGIFTLIGHLIVSSQVEGNLTSSENLAFWLSIFGIVINIAASILLDFLTDDITPKEINAVHCGRSTLTTADSIEEAISSISPVSVSSTKDEDEDEDEDELY